MGKYFGTDGFRGEAGVAPTATHAYQIGRFLGWYGRHNGKKMRVAVGKDTRLSCYMLEYAVAAGLVASVPLRRIDVPPIPIPVSFVAIIEGERASSDGISVP